MAYDVRSSAPGEVSQTRLVSAAITFSQSSVSVDTLAVGDMVVAIWFVVTTAFNAGTTNVITAGDGTTGNKYLAAADVTEGTPGVYPATVKQAFAPESSAGTLTVSYAQTGTAATTGAGRLYAIIANAPA